MTSRPRWCPIRMIVGVALAAIALYAVLVRIDRPALWRALDQADFMWLGIGLVSVFVTLALVTSRWGVLIADVRTPTRSVITRRWRPLWHAVVIGQAVNILFPFRFGEGARVGVTCVELGRDVASVTLAMAFERALDVAAFGAAVLFLAAAGRMPAAFDRLLPTALVLTLLTILAVFLVIRLMPALLHWARGRFGADGRVPRWLAAQEAGVRSAWADLSRGPRLLTAVLLTALVLLSSASTNLLVFRAFNLSVPPVSALVLLAVLQLGTAVVSVPGNVGVFHYLTVLTLATWQVPSSTALATAIVLHVVSLGPRVLLGALAAGTIRREARVVPRSQGPKVPGS